MTVACDVCPVVLLHSGAPQISGASMIERPCHYGRVASVFAPPESTYRAEKTPPTAEKSAERPRQPPRLRYLFGGIGRLEGETQTCARQSHQMPPWGRRLSCVPSCSFQPGATQTTGGEIIERRCRLSGMAFVISPLASTSRANESNVGEEIERIAASTAAPLRRRPADVAEQAERNRRLHVT